jgi:hypothetical protein
LIVLSSFKKKVEPKDIVTSLKVSIVFLIRKMITCSSLFNEPLPIEVNMPRFPQNHCMIITRIASDDNLRNRVEGDLLRKDFDFLDKLESELFIIIYICNDKLVAV